MFPHPDPLFYRAEARHRFLLAEADMARLRRARAARPARSPRGWVAAAVAALAARVALPYAAPHAPEPRRLA